ncbi:MAG TPA: flagellar filament capping protein FliD [Acidobacteriaceae bacterium]|nr:flagellar filament capping protein FliD [Acidobacteriaceae bacterium]
MSVVGLNFGSATSGAGFDVASTVASIVGNLKLIENPWNSQLTALKADDTALTSIGTDLASLSTSLLSLTDFQGVLAEKEGSSSNTNVLSLTSAGPTASAGSHSVVVTKLAQSSSLYSAPIAATDKLSGSLSIQIGSGHSVPVPVVSGTSDTLATYAAAINAADVGVSASVISDTTGSRLSLVSNTGGVAGQITVTGSLTDTTTSSGVALSTGLLGQDAQLTVDGVAVDSGSNTISSAIPGVTFQLLSTSPSTPIQVVIANDNTDVTNAFQTFVTAYNKVAGDLTTQEGNTATGSPEPLYGNPIVAQLQSALALALTSGTASGSVSNLYQLGITASKTGQLSLDTSTLNSTLNSHYSDVVGFLQNADSFGQKFTNSLDHLGSQSPQGSISLALTANSNQEKTLNNNITTQDALIATDQAKYTSELTAANQILQSIPQQLNEVNELYSALTGYNTKQG